MAHVVRKKPVAGQCANELELYQQLVELQKEIIRLAQQNERVEQECTKLRELVATEVSGWMRTRRNVRQKAGRALVQLPGIAAVKSNLVSLTAKELSTC